MSEQTFILPHQQRQLAAFIERLPTARKWKVTITRYARRRSDQQNRYLWGVAYKTLADATGQPAEDWHEYFLGEHFGWEESELFGKRKLRPKNRSRWTSLISSRLALPSTASTFPTRTRT